MAFVSGLDRLVEAVEAAEAAALAKRPPRQVAGGFECPHPDCRRVFSKRYNQQAHMRLHDGTRPFSCQLCGKSFRWKSSLKSHAKMHAKISAIVSGNCDKVPGRAKGVGKRSHKSCKDGGCDKKVLPEPMEIGVAVKKKGRKSLDSVSVVDHAAATVLTMLR